MEKTLKNAFKIKQGDIIAFIGAGGKTSSLVQLQREMKQEQVIIVTTTHFFGFKQFKNTEVLTEEGSDLVQRIKEIWNNNPRERVVVGKKRKLNIKREKEFETEYKIAGIKAGEVKILNKTFPRAIILVEADGARRKQIKVPAAHEPVVPREADIVAPVAGMSALGKKIDDRYCYRVQEILKLVADREIITEEVIIKIFTVKESYGRFHGREGQEYIPVLNQVNDDNREAAERIAFKLKELGIERVLLTNTWRENPLVT